MQKVTRYVKFYILVPIYILFGGCKRLEIFAHTEKGADTYCIYKIGDVKNTGSKPSLKKGDLICLYCSGAPHCVLYTKQWIKLVNVEGNPGQNQIFIKSDTGIAYYLETENPAASCTTCPGMNKFELLPN